MYIKKILIVIALLGLVFCAGFAYYVYNAVFVPNTAFNNEKATLYIATGSSFGDVVADIEPLLEDVETFKRVAERKKYHTAIKAGKYEIKKGMTNNDIVNTLRVNNVPVKITFNNQESLGNLAGRIAKQIEPDSLALLTVLSNEDFMVKNGFSKTTAIGMYVPNTYEFFWNTSAEQFRKRMLAEYKKFWDARKDKVEALSMTPNEVISLAAIVQKETVKTDERPRVAGVYMNRLKKGMKLEADPTVVYAVKQKTGQQLKRVLYEHLKMPSPYNTYLHTGLPPGPITMPDVSSIDAVLNYERHNYLFFVADVQRMGYHKFAKTLSQHNRNAAAYRKWVSKIH